ncbi:hypothetical protein PPTG_05766 [Phytophthora nicotianae INRA-310]|uniref:Sleeping Beauty transposase HTH domain-containing protein n=1 Tax=Phytophthora nicotianae (strain INRA-310) TaxID=761204 RepID=W2QUE6_PHYN3|nr:hypothetical protein PPTG_05766 [Phytophthora nicotianae INRA-310]ETN16586.1 hypothetical protein PPTG_05766 [Phytophthora nicotianae INRA-310]
MSDAELGAGVAASPSASKASNAHAEPPFALQQEIEASIEARTSPNDLQLTDDILRQLMETQGIRDERVLQEMLSTAPYNVSDSYELVQHRVKKLMDETLMHTSSDNGVDTVENEKTTATNAVGDAGKAQNPMDQKKKEAEQRDHDRVARDLDMLANTVRSIATDVVEAEAPLVNGENSIETNSSAAGNAEVETETQNTHKPSVNSNKSAQMTNIAQVTTQDISDAVITIDPSSSDAPEVCNTPATKGNSTKRIRTNEGKATHARKRQKRAEYSVETRALCVRRHQTEGKSYAAISKELGIPHDSVRAIVRKAKRTGSVVSAPRSGRPRKTSGIVDKVILEAVRSNKQCSAKSIQEELLRVYGVKLSPETVRRRVLEHTKQRIQSISNGSSALEDKSGTTSTVAPETPTTPSHDDLAALNTSEREISTIDKRTNKVATNIPTKDMGLDPDEMPNVPSQLNEERSTPKRKKRGEYSIEKREQCVSLHAQGQGYRRIGKTLNMPHTTVRAIVEKAQRTGTVLPAKRSGRPRKTDAIVDKVILQAVKTNERSSARIIKEQLQAAYGVRVSCETIRRRVKDHSRQCLSSALDASPDMLSSSGAVDALSQGENLETGATMPSSPSMPASTLMTFVANGVHI